MGNNNRSLSPVVCPCCNGAGVIEPAAPVALSPTEFAVWDAVRQSRDGLTAPALAARIYADRPDGGPEFAKGCIYAAIKSANRRLRAAGIAITCGTRTRGGVYRIQHIDGAAP
jgi:hypothetical protein